MSNEQLIERLIDLAFEEDIATGDITTESIIPESSKAIATMTAKGDGVISGIDIVEKVFRRFSNEVEFTPFKNNGDRVTKGEVILKIEASYPTLLMAERTALNFFQRMSGIATETAKYVAELEGTHTQLLDTRKTAPGMRVTDKMAVKDGGGTNHRMGLYDMVMIKDNHIKMAGTIAKAVEQVRAKVPADIKVEVETTNLVEVQEAIDAKADIIMLDNMSNEDMAKAVELIAGRAKTEASGNMSIPRLKEVAATGVDFISVGALTHSVKGLDISMNISLKKEHLISEILRYKKEKNAVIFAHYYVAPEIQDIADFVGDSLELSKKAASVDADCIVFCGVKFMGETAAVISPNKKVILPVVDAGCSLADGVTGEELAQWKRENPDGVVVSYVNTTADTKAFTDVCCTSANAVRVAEAVAQGKVPGLPKTDKIVFVPDENLGRYINHKGDLGMKLWRGNCVVHQEISAELILQRAQEYPQADILIHPESSCSGDPRVMSHPRCYFYSTSGILNHVASSPKNHFVIATETGVMHKLQKDNPGKVFIPVSDQAVCKEMKKVTLEALYYALKNDRYVVQVPEEVAKKAIIPVERMMAL